MSVRIVYATPGSVGRRRSKRIRIYKAIKVVCSQCRSYRPSGDRKKFLFFPGILTLRFDVVTGVLQVFLHLAAVFVVADLEEHFDANAA